MSVQEMAESIKKIPEQLDAFRTAAPHLPALMKWMFDPKAGPLDQSARPGLIALGGLFVGTTDGQIAKYLDENLWIERKNEKGEVIKTPGSVIDCHDPHAPNYPKMIVDFVAEMDPADLTKMLQENPEVMAKIQEAFLQTAPTLTLSSIFKKNVEGAMPAIQEILSSKIENVDLKRMDTAAEVGEFFSYMPKEQVEAFVKKFKEETDNSSWLWDGVEIKISNYDDPAEVKKAITEGVAEAIRVGGDSPILSPIRAGIQEKINKTLEDMKTGKSQLTPEMAAQHLIDQAKDPAKQQALLDLISTGNENDRKLKEEYQKFITVDLLMKNKDALVNSYMPQNVAEMLGGFKDMLGALDGIIPGISKIIGQFAEAVIPMVERFMPQNVAAAPAVGATG
ncbi:MAG TPA: hypothetical protein PLO23_02335 [Alphaproteobacteria bacterium]|nr:hypothetical protein [Alphaproteobacteria bacterium]